MPTKVMSTSDSTSSHTDLELQNDQLWSIITQQKNVIRDLESTVATLIKERDLLLLRSTTTTTTTTSPPATPPSPLTCPQEPVPPPRSPYRQHHHRQSYDDTNVDTNLTISNSSETTSHSDDNNTTVKAGPIHAILDKDAELYANYQKTTTKSLTPSSSLSSGINNNDETESQSSATPQPTTDDDIVMTPTDLNTNNYTCFCTTMELKVLEINIQHTLKNKEPITFILSISSQQKELWRIKKGYSEFMALDTLLRSHLRSLSNKTNPITVKIRKLPTKSLFTCTKSSANTNMDQKKRAIEKYLTNVVRLPLPETMDLIQFLTTGILEQKEPSSSSKHKQCEKEGYLSLYGKQSKKWSSYYFMLHGSTLDYYDSNDGPLIGSILLKGSHITVQRSSPSGLFYHTSPRSTMTITQATQSLSISKPHTQQQHILRMTSDMELDEWIHVLPTGTQQPLPQVSRSECIGTTTGAINNTSHLPSRKRISNRILPSTKHSPPQRSQSDNSVHSAMLTPSITTTLDTYHRSLPQPQQQQQQQQRQRKRSSIDAIFYSTRRSTPSKDTSHQEMHSIRHTPSISSLLPSASTSLLTRRHDPKKATAAATKLNRRTFWPKSMFLGHDSTTTTNMNNNNGSSHHGLRHFLTRHSTDNLSSTSPCPTPSLTTHCLRPTVSTSITKPFKSDPLTKIPTHPVFGVSLEKALQISKTHGLPTIVYRCIQFLEKKKAIYEEGIYRISGSTIKIKGLRRRFDEQGDIDLLTLEEYRDCDIHAVSGLLKLWLRELPGHILTDHLIDSFILVKDSTDRHECINKLTRLVNQLPSSNYTLLRALMSHFHYVTRNANINKMTLRNLGIVFSPTLGIPTSIFDLFSSEFDSIFTSRRRQHRTTTTTTNRHTTVLDGTSDRRLTVTFGTSQNGGDTSDDGMELVVLDRPRPMIKT